MFRKLLISACLLYSCASLHAASITARATASCAGITNMIEGTVPTGPVAANPDPCSVGGGIFTNGSAAASALADYGQLSGSSSHSGNVGNGGSLASFYDLITILNGPANGYLRMFYTFEYSAQFINPGPGMGNGLGATVTFGTVPSVTVGITTSVGGTWSSTVTGSADFELSGTGVASVFAQVDTGSGCVPALEQSCSVSAVAALTITGWQVLDANLAPDVDATIQAESGASYAAPEPGTGLLLMGAAGIFYLGRRFSTRCPDASA